MSSFGYDGIRMFGSARSVHEAFSSPDLPSHDDQNIDETGFCSADKPRLLSRRGTVPRTPSVYNAFEEITTLQPAGKKLDACETQPVRIYSTPERSQPARSDATLPVLCGPVKPASTPPQNTSRCPAQLSRVVVREDISKMFSLAKVSGSTSKFPLVRSNSHSVNNSPSMPRMKPLLTRSATCPSDLESKINERSEWISLPLTNSHTNKEREQTTTAGTFALPPMQRADGGLTPVGRTEEDSETLKVSNSTDTKLTAQSLELSLGHKQTALPSRLRRFNRTCPQEIGGMKALTLDGTACLPIHTKIMTEEWRRHAQAINMHVERENEDYNVIETKAEIMFEWLKGQK